MTAWNYDRTLNPLQFEGFVYKISNMLTGQEYIGRKYIWRVHYEQMVLNGENKQVLTRTLSNWPDYWSSCNALLADVELYGKESFIREILSWHKTRSHTDYAEIVAQFQNDVLHAKLPNGKQRFYNKNIMNKWFVQ
jgi:Zn/Cd-binding protein ZinT